ncbi:MAG TPA: hypothetical protein VL053_08150, partial [Arachidicoccus sp.]|nr:hypothetical protein [Arachidicoccus sp.]
HHSQRPEVLPPRPEWATAIYGMLLSPLYDLKHVDLGVPYKVRRIQTQKIKKRGNIFLRFSMNIIGTANGAMPVFFHLFTLVLRLFFVNIIELP